MHATEMYQEGLLIPPVKVYDRGEFQKDVFNMIVSNSRIPRFFEGDLKAQIAACRLAQKRLTQLINKYGIATIKDCVRMLADYSERLMREGISKIPDGVYEADHYCDDDGVEGKPVKIHVKITKKDTDIVVDFTGTDPQPKGPLNSPLAVVLSGVYSGIYFMTLPEVKSNTGCYRPVKIIAPEGSLVNPRPPAPTVMMNDTYQRIHDLIVYALATARPEKAYAGCIGGTMSNYIAGIHPKTKEYYIAPFLFSMLSGWGAHYCKDGKNSTAQPAAGSAIRNMPIEIFETKYPFRVKQYAMKQDSGGSGKFRGGLGGTIEMSPLGDITVTQQFQSVRFPPYGLSSGKSGRPSKAVIDPGKVNERILPPMISGVEIKKGQTYRVTYSGGGGWGNPFERNPQKVLDDVIKEYVSLKRAREDYGVVIDPDTLQVDYEATERIRK